MKAVVTGMIATYPVGGVAWDYGQYAVGLERLGFDVFYLEDTGSSTYDPVQRLYGDAFDYAIEFLAASLRNLSPTLADRWHFRAADGSSFGIDAAHMRALVADADLFLNVSGSALLRDEYMPCRRKVLIDTDPGWNHFVNYPKWDRSPGWQGTHGYRAHDHFFTYAENIGQPDCRLPLLDLPWRPTRPPVILDCWNTTPPGSTWTTVMTWDNFRKSIVHGGVEYGTKEREFGRVEDLPGKVDAKFEVAVGGASPPVDQWRKKGWSVVDSHSVSGTMNDYRTYIESSRGELSVAKNVYVATRSGWFSCRSVCYLAAGKPVVVQDTGFSNVLPVGEGVLAFSSEEEALAAIETVESDYSRHQMHARRVAEECFASSVVIGKLLREIGIG